ncbi:MAG: hypothetical protein ACTSX2_03655 [Candidatus Thorarchaeota archaeon]
MMTSEKTNYVYEFEYSSGPGRQEVFRCKYVSPDEALKRFRTILALTKSPFDFKIVIRNESTKEESSYEVMGDVDEMLEKFRVFLETTTGEAILTATEETVDQSFEDMNIDAMSNYEKMQMVIYASFKHGKFSSLDVMEIYESTFGEELAKSTTSTYLARMWDKGQGHLERYGNRSGYMYRLRTEVPNVQKAIERAEQFLAAVQIRLR